MFYNGRGVPQNYAEAMKWYRLAADQGQARAQSGLGGMYASGQGVPKNDAEAIKWFRLAANQGNATAQVNLGGMVANGPGIPPQNAIMRSKLPSVGIMLVLGLLVLGGFVFPLLFLPAAVLGWVVLQGLTSSEEVPRRSEGTRATPRRVVITAEEHDWEEAYILECESPAEEAFLLAMIAAYGLKPQHGALQGGGLKLDLQIDLPPYRMDFLADGWLVIEIDGAAYHSSPQAIASDKKRDAFMRNLGYSVIRIPAKTVFGDALATIRLVRAAIAQGRAPQPVPEVVPPPPQLTVPRILNSIGGFLSDISRSAEIAGAVQIASGPGELVFEREKRVINAAIKVADVDRDVRRQRDQSPEWAADFDAAFKETMAAIEATKMADARKEVVTLLANTPPPAPSVPTTVRHLPPGSLDPEDAEGSPRSCPCSTHRSTPRRVPPRTEAVGRRSWRHPPRCLPNYRIGRAGGRLPRGTSYASSRPPIAPPRPGGSARLFAAKASTPQPFAIGAVNATPAASVR